MTASTQTTAPTAASSAAPTLARGLEGVIAGQTAICSVEQGALIYRGYEIHDLASTRRSRRSRSCCWRAQALGVGTQAAPLTRSCRSCACPGR